MNTFTIALVVAVVVVGAGEVLLFPFRRCRTCNGSGKIFSPLNPTRNWRDCGNCGGKGKKLRFLAWLVRGLFGLD